MDKSTAGRRNVKLTGFKHRVDRPTGLISFSTGHDEDITGLDEAMRSFSSKTNSIGTPPSTVTALSIPLASKSDIEPTLSTDSDREPSILSCSDADTFELAVEATTMADDSPVPVSSSSGHSLLSFESPNSDHPHPATSKLSNSHEDSETTPVSTMATVLDIDFRTAVEPVNQPPFASIGSTGECDNGDPSKPPVPPARPPPFQPRSVATPVAAADIHALLDSYPSPIRDADIPNSRLTKPSSLPVITCASPARNDDVLTSHLDIVPSQKPFTEEVGGPLLVSALSDLPISSIRAEEASSSIPLTVLREDATERDSNLSLGLPTEFDKVKSDLASGDDRKRPFASSKRIHSRRIAQRRRSKLCNIFLLASVGLLVGCVYWFTAFFWGLSVGVLGTLLVVLIRDALWTTDNSDGARCHISGSPLGRLCCSLHCPINPTATGAGSGTWWPIFAPALPPLRNGPLQFRELPSLPVPHMNDEDLYSSTIGPLGPNLGLKLDSGDRPIYKGWMNEIMKYDAETHHVSQTHSVFITLDGMQLRLQRPRRNIARRSMWNEEIPPIGSLRFHQQRIYDLTHARVVLLPNGLVMKRLWSKKYPIAITLSPQAAKQVNLMRWNQRNRLEWEAANLADDISQLPSPSAPSTGDQPRRPSRLGAYLSDEEDSADSTTDSDPTEEPRYPAAIGVRRPSVPTRPPVAAASVGLNKSTEEERAGVTENLAFQLPPTISSRKRIIRIVDKITRSSYFQKAVDNKLVQRGMELLSNTPIVLEAEIQTLSGTLLINIPPPQSDRLWYGFRPNLQMRLKVRPRVGEKAVTMSRILEWIENRVLLEFQRLVVLPNMDDIVIPLLLSDVTAGGTK
ncbi:unnamed protein product [Dicrocoelium dendriticum]|nr:unnamed protein product [Dicrocoelium dendriticum]